MSSAVPANAAADSASPAAREPSAAMRRARRNVLTQHTLLRDVQSGLAIRSDPAPDMANLTLIDEGTANGGAAAGAPVTRARRRSLELSRSH